MSKCIYWTEASYNEFMAKSGNLLNHRQKRIVDMRVKDELSIQQMSARLNVSEPTIHKDIKRIKEVYSMLSKNNKSLHPIFKNSKQLDEYIGRL